MWVRKLVKRKHGQGVNPNSDVLFLRKVKCGVKRVNPAPQQRQPKIPSNHDVSLIYMQMIKYMYVTLLAKANHS